MKTADIRAILNATDYIRTGGSAEELKTAEYLMAYCEKLGVPAHLEDFPVQMAEVHDSHLIIDGREYPCKGYKNCGSGEVTAPFIYLPNRDPASLAQAKGKIVMIDGGVTYFHYHDLLDNGALAIVSYMGDVNYRDRDIDQKELRGYVSKGRKVPCVGINVKDAVDIMQRFPKNAEIRISQDEWEGNSRNVVAELPGTSDEWICMTAHYDSTPLSHGAYDNMTGCITLLGTMEDLVKKAPHHYGIRFIFCGSEERGLLGSKAYVAAHEAELEKIALDINIDMIGTAMGKFIACSTADESLVSYIRYMASEMGWGIRSYQGVYSSDSTPFADKGVPAVSFARAAGNAIAPIHNRYDTKKVLLPEQIQKDVAFVSAFTARMADAVKCPIPRTIPDKMKDELDKYLIRKRREA